MTSLTNLFLFSDDGLSEARKLCQKLGYSPDNADDIKIIQFVCARVSVRTAYLVSAVLALLLDRIDKPVVSIAIDGSVYKKHPKLHTLITDFIRELSPERKFKVFLAEDGSGKGAGLVAAIAQRLKNLRNDHLNANVHV